jgi:hypothetical protein
MSFSNRAKTYTHISTKLTGLSDATISELINKATPMHAGIGGSSALLTLDDTPIFVKKIPLTDLEQQPGHHLSTANLFDLPLFYQYGVGSGGFGAWRELVAHIMTTNWVISGDCLNFPILYHWRILPTPKPKSMDAKQTESLERDVKYWENSPAIRNRLEAKHEACAHIVLFLEYIPQTLHQWLGEKLKIGGNIAETAILLVDRELKLTSNFMNEHGLIHFDAHFENVLTDGKLIYFSDFGLALSSQFDLTKEEINFLNVHHTYDRCATIVNLLHCVITHLFGKDRWEIRLKEYINREHEILSSSLDATLRQYASIALVMDEFYQKLQKESKSTPYPAVQLEQALAIIDQKVVMKS